MARQLKIARLTLSSLFSGAHTQLLMATKRLQFTLVHAPSMFLQVVSRVGTVVDIAICCLVVKVPKVCGNFRS